MNARITLIAIVLFATTAHAQVTINGSGSFPTIQAAINAAQNGDTINVPAGAYAENLVITGKHLTIDGAGGLLTSINGGGTDRCLRVIQSGPGTTTIRNMRLSNGLAPGGAPGPDGVAGGALYATSNSPASSYVLRVENSTIVGSSADFGAGIFAAGGVKLELVSSVVMGNAPPAGSMAPFGSGGGGIFCEGGAEIDDSLISNNSCSSTVGGGLPGVGGGIYVSGGTGVTTILDCNINDNSARFGGGIGGDIAGDVSIGRSNFQDNTVVDGGGAAIDVIPIPLGPGLPPAADLNLRDSLVTGNTSPTGNAAGIFSAAINTRIINSTIAGNGNPGQAAPAIEAALFQPVPGSSLRLRNAIVTSNGNDVVRGLDLDSIIVTDSLLSSGVTPGGFFPPNVTTNGMLVGLAPAFLPGTARPLPGSPCVNAGTSGPNDSMTDLDGNPRVVGAAVDMGCFELQNEDPGADFAGTVVGGDVLLFNGTAGGPTRSVTVDAGSTCTISVSVPTDGVPVATSPFIIWGHLGVPTPADAYPIDFLGSNMAFTPHLVDLGNPLLFTFTNNILTPNSGLLLSTPAPWSVTGPCAPFPITMTLQGLIADGSGPLQITNAITLHAR